MALRALQGPTGGGAPVGGTGTTNTIPRWTGPSTLGDSIITQSGTNRIGVTGAIWCDVAGGVGGVAFGITDSASIRQTGTNAIMYFDASATSGNGQFVWRSGNSFTERARIDSAGNFGIKQSSPSSWEPGMRDLVIGALDGSSYGITLASITQTTLAFSNGTTGAQKYAGFVQYSPGTSRLDFGAGGAARVGVITTGLDVSTAGYGLKLPATPGNADTQTLDCYNEGSLTSGFTLSGITTSAGNVNYTARWTRIGRAIALSLRIYPDAGQNLTFASGWSVTMTGVPQIPVSTSCAATSDDGTIGRSSVHITATATPVAYGGTAGAYVLGANSSLYISGMSN